MIGLIIGGYCMNRRCRVVMVDVRLVLLRL